MTTTETVTTKLADAHGVKWQARGLAGRTDRPADMGGGDAGPMASELVLIALASCTTTTALKIATKRKVALTDVRCEASMDFDERGEVIDVRLRVDVESHDDEQDVLKVFELAERACTITKLLAIEPDVVVVIQKTS